MVLKLSQLLAILEPNYLTHISVFYLDNFECQSYSIKFNMNATKYIALILEIESLQGVSY
jgi:hypothetical protein